MHKMLRRFLSTTSSPVKSSLNTSTGVATVLLNFPEKRNALSSTMLFSLGQEMDKVIRNSATKVIVIKSSHPAVFSSGHDLGELVPGLKGTPAPADDVVHENHVHLFNLCSEVMLKIHFAPQPVIAEINGVATAAGCQLVATCDLAYASDDSQFATPGVNIGLFCSTPAVPLVRTVAPKHALEMLLTGEMISAKRAEEIGLINRVVKKEDLSQVVMELAEKIGQKSKSALRIGKKTLRTQIDMNITDAYRHTGATMVDNMGTKDAKEGIGAFLQKRTPEWSDL